MTTITTIEGIGPANAKKLRAAGIRTTERLLAEGASRKGRKALATSCKIDEKKILEWVNRADLMRVRGVGEEYSDLLEHAGVDTVKELSKRKPANLYQTCKDVCARTGTRVVRRPPSAGEVSRWVAHAKKLDKVVTY